MRFRHVSLQPKHFQQHYLKMMPPTAAVKMAWPPFLSWGIISENEEDVSKVRAMNLWKMWSISENEMFEMVWMRRLECGVWWFEFEFEIWISENAPIVVNSRGQLRPSCRAANFGRRADYLKRWRYFNWKPGPRLLLRHLVTTARHFCIILYNIILFFYFLKIYPLPIFQSKAFA